VELEIKKAKDQDGDALLQTRHGQGVERAKRFTERVREILSDAPDRVLNSFEYEEELTNASKRGVDAMEGASDTYVVLEKRKVELEREKKKRDSYAEKVVRDARLHDDAAAIFEQDQREIALRIAEVKTKVALEEHEAAKKKVKELEFENVSLLRSQVALTNQLLAAEKPAPEVRVMISSEAPARKFDEVIERIHELDRESPELEMNPLEIKTTEVVEPMVRPTCRGGEHSPFSFKKAFPGLWEVTANSISMPHRGAVIPPIISHLDVENDNMAKNSDRGDHGPLSERHDDDEAPTSPAALPSPTGPTAASFVKSFMESSLDLPYGRVLLSRSLKGETLIRDISTGQILRQTHRPTRSSPVVSSILQGGSICLGDDAGELCRVPLLEEEEGEALLYPEASLSSRKQGVASLGGSGTNIFIGGSGGSVMGYMNPGKTFNLES